MSLLQRLSTSYIMPLLKGERNQDGFLDEIERKENVKILHCVESGSRAWGVLIEIVIMMCGLFMSGQGSFIFALIKPVTSSNGSWMIPWIYQRLGSPQDAGFAS